MSQFFKPPTITLDFGCEAVWTLDGYISHCPPEHKALRLKIQRAAMARSALESWRRRTAPYLNTRSFHLMRVSEEEKRNG